MGPDHVRPSARSVTIILTAAVALIATGAGAAVAGGGGSVRSRLGNRLPARLSAGEAHGTAPTISVGANPVAVAVGPGELTRPTSETGTTTPFR